MSKLFLKIVNPFCTKIPGYIRNYFHHGGDHPHQEVGGGYSSIKHSDAYTLKVDELIQID